jgi:histidinol-phosphate aminotransferase
MADLEKLVRENVRRLVPYSSARDEFSGKDGIFMDANENPYGNLNRYPDPYQRELKAVISKIKGIPEENIFLGNGSDEVIDLCFRIFCSPGTDTALTFSPTYGMYEVSAEVNDVKIIKVPLNDSFQIDMPLVMPLLNSENLKLIFICSPNNPTGNCFNSSDIESIICNFHGIVIIDEAYIDFSDRPSFTEMTNRYSNLIVMQTLSKAMGLAAVRIGMAITNPAIIRYFNRIKPPYNISTVNQKAALKMLSAKGENKKQIKMIIRERDRLSENLMKMSITQKIFPTDANFILVKVKDATAIYNSLVENNIVVRNRTTLVNNCLRITVGKPTENDALVNALNSFGQ